MPQPRNIRPRDLALLWGRAAGMCCHPLCRTKLDIPANGKDDAASIGQAAHIVAHCERGPRGVSYEFTLKELDRYPNLILLCANHHAEVDAQENTYTVEVLRSWKTEHEAWVDSLTSARRTRLQWTVILQEPGTAIDVALVNDALGSANQVVSLVELRNNPDAEGWEAAARREWVNASVAVSGTPADRRRFAVFSLGRIPLAVQLGYVLSDRVRADLYQYDRDRASWAWDDSAEPSGSVQWALSNCDEGPADEAAIRVSLSAAVLPVPRLRCGVEIDIAVPEPSVRWLRAPSQLVELARIYGEVLAAIRARGCRRVHLYYAGPAPGAIVFGRGYNPRMNPELVVYEYCRDAATPYFPALILNR